VLVEEYCHNTIQLQLYSILDSMLFQHFKILIVIFVLIYLRLLQLLLFVLCESQRVCFDDLRHLQDSLRAVYVASIHNGASLVFLILFFCSSFYISNFEVKMFYVLSYLFLLLFNLTNFLRCNYSCDVVITLLIQFLLSFYSEP
jgi:hypothetical protein